jgi:hypothetical protein
MTAVAVIAVDLCVIRSIAPGIGEVVAVGVLPMANVLTIGFLMGRHSRRPFFWGFLAFGVTALIGFVALGVFAEDSVMMPYAELWAEPIHRALDRYPQEVHVAVMVPVCIIMFGLPQLAVALVGGFLSRSYLKPRPPGEHFPGSQNRSFLRRGRRSHAEPANEC